jgi:hypothetical protein
LAVNMVALRSSAASTSILQRTGLNGPEDTHLPTVQSLRTALPADLLVNAVVCCLSKDAATARTLLYDAESDAQFTYRPNRHKGQNVDNEPETKTASFRYEFRAQSCARCVTVIDRRSTRDADN